MYRGQGQGSSVRQFWDPGFKKVFKARVFSAVNLMGVKYFLAQTQVF